MDDARRKFLDAVMAGPIFWEAATSIDNSVGHIRGWHKAREVYKTYMESYAKNVPMVMTPDPDSVHMQMVSAHAVALASVLAKFV
jgi:hypothetical protein